MLEVSDSHYPSGYHCHSPIGKIGDSHSRTKTLLTNLRNGWQNVTSEIARGARPELPARSSYRYNHAYARQKPDGTYEELTARGRCKRHKANHVHENVSSAVPPQHKENEPLHPDALRELEWPGNGAAPCGPPDSCQTRKSERSRSVSTSASLKQRQAIFSTAL